MPDPTTPPPPSPATETAASVSQQALAAANGFNSDAETAALTQDLWDQYHQEELARNEEGGKCSPDMRQQALDLAEVKKHQAEMDKLREKIRNLENQRLVGPNPNDSDTNKISWMLKFADWRTKFIACTVSFSDFSVYLKRIPPGDGGPRIYSPPGGGQTAYQHDTYASRIHLPIVGLSNGAPTQPVRGIVVAALPQFRDSLLVRTPSPISYPPSDMLATSMGLLPRQMTPGIRTGTPTDGR